MKKALILILLCASLTLSGATYYVSPNGSDSNSGSTSSPFLTLNKAWSVVSAGDIIYMRGGTYRYGTTMTVLQDKSGTSSSPIKIMAYPGENPVIDYAGENLTGQKIALRLHNISYVYFQGFRICNMNQENTADAWPQYGIILYDNVSNCTFEKLEVDHIGGTGFTIADGCNNNLFLNCDSHHHQDPYSSNPYGMSDGFESGSHGTNASTNNTFRGCRAWANSDDGWDFRQADGVHILDKCWSFWNGYIPASVDNGTWQSGGNGEGYKMGGKTAPGTNSVIRTIKNSISVRNKGRGIGASSDAADLIYGLEVYNCFVWGCAREWGEGIESGNYNAYMKIQNSISFGNNGRTDWWNRGNAIDNHNSWNSGVTVTSSDFASLDDTQLDNARQSSGALPVVTFGHLVQGSDLIAKGIAVSGNTTDGDGLTWRSQPSLGAFESGSTAQVTATPPVLASGVVENATPSSLSITYNMGLNATILPAPSSYSVTVNQVANAVKTVAISGSSVQLTLTTAIKFGDVIKVAYTKPSANPLQSTSGGIAESFAAITPTNNLASITKNPAAVTITMAFPKYVHKTLNASLTYSSLTTDQAAVITPEVLRILDTSDKLYVEKLLTTGTTSIKIPINLQRGIYVVKIFGNGVEMVSNKISVY